MLDDVVDRWGMIDLGLDPVCKSMVHELIEELK